MTAKKDGRLDRLGFRLTRFIRTRFIHVIVSVTVLALAAIIAYTYWGEPLADSLGNDVYRLHYQFLLIVVLGGIGTYLLSEYATDKEARRTQRAQEHALQREFYQDLIQSYNAAKKSRRLLRAMVNGNERMVPMERYDELMQELEDTQLQFEFFKKEVPVLFSRGDEPDTIEDYIFTRLERMEKYLGNITKEYESHYDPTVEYKPISELDGLREFITRNKEKPPEKNEFKREFNHLLDEVADKVLEFLTGLTRKKTIQ